MQVCAMLRVLFAGWRVHQGNESAGRRLGHEELVPGRGKPHAARLPHPLHSLQACREQTP